MNQRKYHITASGDWIPLKELSDSHLNNIIAMIERKAVEGIEVVWGGGWGDFEEIWSDVDELFDEEVYDHFDYPKYVNERKRRAKTKTSS
jgi:hypothetical protein